MQKRRFVASDVQAQMLISSCAPFLLRAVVDINAEEETPPPVMKLRLLLTELQ